MFHNIKTFILNFYWLCPSQAKKHTGITDSFGFDLEPFLTARFHLDLMYLSRADDNTNIKKKEV